MKIMRCDNGNQIGVKSLYLYQYLLETMELLDTRCLLDSKYFLGYQCVNGGQYMNGIQWSEMEQNGELWSRELWSGVVLDMGK